MQSCCHSSPCDTSIAGHQCTDSMCALLLLLSQLHCLQGGEFGFALPIWVLSAAALVVAVLAFAFQGPAEAMQSHSGSPEEQQKLRSEAS